MTDPMLYDEARRIADAVNPRLPAGHRIDVQANYVTMTDDDGVVRHIVASWAADYTIRVDGPPRMRTDRTTTDTLTPAMLRAFARIFT